MECKTKCDMRRSNARVPLYVVDEHNEAFYCWHKAHAEGCLNEPLDLFHVDAHDDMGRPGTFRSSLYAPSDSPDGNAEYYRDFANTELHNGNFIIPAVLGGLVRNVYFIYPKWRKFKPGRKRFNVSSVFGEGKIMKYGMKAEENMEGRMHKALPDFTSYSYCMRDIDGIPRNRRVILDIDLDYFACRDSIQNQFRYELAITAEQYRNRDALLSDKTLAFAGLSFEFLERDGGYAVQVAPALGKDVAHLPAKDEVTAEIGALVDALRARKIRPVVVTIARSCISGYCPADYVSMIERELTRKLEPFLAA
jgi:hypothetical protein